MPDSPDGLFSVGNYVRHRHGHSVDFIMTSDTGSMEKASHAGRKPAGVRDSNRKLI